MSQLDQKIALVTGGSRGLGRGIVEAVAAEGTQVWALARKPEHLELLKRQVKAVQTLTADVADPLVATRTLREIRPDILVLNAGAMPAIMPTHQQTWEQFSRTWETDVKATFHFGKEAILMPMPPGTTIIIMSSGASLSGSPLSGGYAGAKRTQWFLAQYFQQEAKALNLDIRFVALVPQQIVGTTDLGYAAASAYATHQGLSKEAFLDRMGTPLTAQGIGQGVVALLTQDAYSEGIAFGIAPHGLVALT